MHLADLPIEPVGKARIEEHLYQDQHGQQCDDQRLLDDGLALKGKEKHWRGEQGGD